MRFARTTAVVCGSFALSMFVPSLANADPQVGGCTSSYEPTTYAELSSIDAALTTELFDVIDSNDNGVLCFKPYSNGDHHGHAGNLVDDKSGPKS